MNPIKTSAVIAVMFLAVACSRQRELSSAPAPAAPPAPILQPQMEYNKRSADKETSGAGAPAAQATRRYIALTHHLVVEFQQGRLQGAYEATLQRCEQLGCNVLQANSIRETEFTSPSANLQLRVPPKSLDELLSGLNKEGVVLQHRLNSEDKTDAVIDAEAKIKNLMELRDRLRTMLTTRTAKLSEVIEVEEKLSSTQAELDSVTGVRKVLANETDMVAVTIDFQAKRSIGERHFIAPVASAWNAAGHVFMESAAGLITFVAAVIPWFLLIIPVFLLLRRMWRKRKSALKH